MLNTVNYAELEKILFEEETTKADIIVWRYNNYGTFGLGIEGNSEFKLINYKLQAAIEKRALENKPYNKAVVMRNYKTIIQVVKELVVPRNIIMSADKVVVDVEPLDVKVKTCIFTLLSKEGRLTECVAYASTSVQHSRTHLVNDKLAAIM